MSCVFISVDQTLAGQRSGQCFRGDDSNPQKDEDSKQKVCPHLRIFSGEAQILGIFYTWPPTVTQGVERSMLSKGGIKKKETLQHHCKGELTGKEETSERNSTPPLCSNEAKITNVRVIKATVRVLLCLKTAAASGACNIIGTIRQTFWSMTRVTLLKTQRVNGRKGYNKIQGTFHINRLGRKKIW